MRCRTILYHPFIKERGGGEKVVLRILQNTKHEIDLFTHFYNERATFDEFKDFELKVLGENSDSRKRTHPAFKYSLVHAFTDLPTEEYDAMIVSLANIGSLITLRNNSIPAVGYCHTPLRDYSSINSFTLNMVYNATKPIYNLIARRAWNSFEYIFVNSEVTKKRIIDNGLADKSELTVLHPGIDTPESTVSNFEPIFLYPSRFVRYKRQKLVVKSFNRVESDKYKLVLAGSAQDKQYLEELHNLKDDNVIIKTDLSEKEMEELYRRCYTVLYFPRDEDWGLVPLESAAYGKPVIGVNEGGPKKTIINGETGVLIPPSLEKIAKEISYFINNTKLVHKLGENAKNHAKKYSWEGFVNTIDSAISYSCINNTNFS
jgi:glycosyltransferase involved in cell wall biosynthesis